MLDCLIVGNDESSNLKGDTIIRQASVASSGAPALSWRYSSGSDACPSSVAEAVAGLAMMADGPSVSAAVVRPISLVARVVLSLRQLGPVPGT